MTSLVQEFSGAIVRRRGLSNREYRNMFTSLRAICEKGSPIDEAIRLVSLSSLSSKTRTYARAIYGQIRRGSSFSTALEQFDPSLDPVVIACIRASEEASDITGGLDAASSVFVNEVDKQNSRAADALYPALIIISSLAMAIFYRETVYDGSVVPMLEMRSVDPDTDSQTSFLYFMVNNYYLVLLVSLLLASTVFLAPTFVGFAGRHWFAIHPSRYNLIALREEARFLSSLCSCLKGGVLPQTAVLLAAQSISEKRLRDESILQLMCFEKGETLQCAVAKLRFLSSETKSLISGIQHQNVKVGIITIRTISVENMEKVNSYYSSIRHPIYMIVSGLFVCIAAIGTMAPTIILISSY